MLDLSWSAVPGIADAYAYTRALAPTTDADLQLFPSVWLVFAFRRIRDSDQIFRGLAVCLQEIDKARRTRGCRYHGLTV